MSIGLIATVMALAIPIVSIISKSMIKMKQLNSTKSDQVDQEDLERLYRGIQDMKKRIINLETILHDKDKRG